MARDHLHLLRALLFVATIVASPSSTVSAKSLASTTVAPPTAAPPTASSSTVPTAYDMLERYNLTRGILPEGVTGYVLQPDGSFEVHLPRDCNIHAGNMQITYSSRIAGNIQPQMISDLEGVKVEMLVWIDITKVTRTDDQLNFFAGLISKSFPIGTFANSLRCN